MRIFPVVRGGASGDNEQYVKAAIRFTLGTHGRIGNLGFRVVLQ